MSRSRLQPGLRYVAIEHDFNLRAHLTLMSGTQIMLGVHGNGLSHLLFMKPSRASAVIEMFYPGGFAHDYHWTSRALGMDHYAVWNDKYVFFFTMFVSFTILGTDYSSR
jgi:hypothetical protein